MTKVSLNEQKQQLLAERELYKQTLLGEVQDLKENALEAKDILIEEAIDLKNNLIATKNRVLLVASGLIIGYVIFKSIKGIIDIFVKEEPTAAAPPIMIAPKTTQAVYHPEADKQPTFLSTIIDEIKREMTAFLLGIAKKKLQEFLEELYLQQIQEKKKKP